MKSHPGIHLVVALASIVGIMGVCHGQDHPDHALPSLEEMAAAVLAHPEDEPSAYMFVSRSLSENSSALEKLHADLLQGGHKNTPAETMVRVGSITLGLQTGKYKETLVLLGEVCEHINRHRDSTSLSRRIITDSLNGILPIHKTKEDDFTQLDLIRVIREKLDVDMAADWRFFMNHAVLQLAAEVELDQARDVLDKLQSVIPPQEKPRWVYNSAHLHLLNGEIDKAVSELATLEVMCKDSKENYCDVLNEYLVGMKKAIQRERISEAGLKHIAGEADMLVLSSLSELDAGKAGSTSEEKAGKSVPEEAQEQAEENPEVQKGDAALNAHAADVVRGGPQGLYNVPLWAIISACSVLGLVAVISAVRKNNTLAVASLALLTICILGAGFVRHNTSTSQRPALVEDIITLDCTPAEGKVPYHIAIENPTDTMIEILAVKPSCGCTTLVETVNTSMIKPHSRVVLTLEADASSVGKRKSLNTLILLKGYAPLIHQALVSGQPAGSVPLPASHPAHDGGADPLAQRT